MKGDAAKRRPYDPTIYPEEERVGEDILQRWILEILRPLVQRWLAGRRVQALVGADQFIYYRQHDPHARVAPDLYVLPGVSPRRRVRSWKLWLDRVVPSFALEVVSQDWEKDYIDVIDRYRELGVKELIVFDPDHRQNKQRVRWQVFRRVGKRGLVRIEVTNGDRVRSKVLNCWLRMVGANGETRLRVATGLHGDELLPTPEEDSERERSEKERERAAKEQEREAKEQERAAKEREREAKEQERAAKEREREAKERERALKETALELLDHERAAKEAALARVRELETAAKRRRR